MDSRTRAAGRGVLMKSSRDQDEALERLRRFQYLGVTTGTTGIRMCNLIQGLYMNLGQGETRPNPVRVLTKYCHRFDGSCQSYIPQRSTEMDSPMCGAKKSKGKKCAQCGQF
jgi:hypothetical protein